MTDSSSQRHQWVNTIAIGLIVLAFALFTFSNGEGVGSEGSSASRLDRVLDTGTIRAGYLVLPPYFDKSAGGEYSGIYYDFMEELGTRMGVSVEWAEEVNMANMAAGFETGRYDIIAFPLWPNARRATNVDFSEPLFYSTVGAYGRVGDSRFDTDLDSINSPDIRISVIDGELAQTIASEDFPLATQVGLPPLADYSQLMLEVISNKSDIAIYNNVLASRFIRANPGSIKRVDRDNLRVFAEAMVLPEGDYRFKEAIDVAIRELVENDYLDRVFRANGENPDDYYMRADEFIDPGM